MLSFLTCVGTCEPRRLRCRQIKKQMRCSGGIEYQSISQNSPVHSMFKLVLLYKTQVLSYVKSRTLGLQFAYTDALQKTNHLQTRFSHEIKLAEEIAFLNFNVAILCVSKNIAILDCRHRKLMCKCYRALRRFVHRAVPAKT